MRIADKIELIAAGNLALELFWDNGVLLRVKLLYGENRQPTGMTGAGRMLHQALERYVAGQPVAWPRVPMALHEQPEFTRTVLTTLRDQVPHGQTTTYGQLAAMAGKPGAARAVGQIMAGNNWPLIIPCHRVLGADGSMVGYSGGGGLDLKRHLLHLEGALTG